MFKVILCRSSIFGKIVLLISIFDETVGTPKLSNELPE